MAITSYSDGSQTAVIDTEHTLSTITLAGYYELTVDLSNMALGDVVDIEVHLKVRGSGTTRLYQQASFAHNQTAPVLATLPVTVLHECIYKLIQTTGTGRAFPWQILVEDSA